MFRSTLFAATIIALLSIAALLLPKVSAGSQNLVLLPSSNRELYLEMGLEGMVNYAAFCQAITGSKRVSVKRPEIITVIDYSKPSTEKRLYVLDLIGKRVLYCTHVSHGKNSGENWATSFSNVSGSYQSSLGFFITGDTYQGRNGYSLLLDGVERGINDRARERYIVIHGAEYSNPSVIASSGRLGRSFGCPALPPKLAAEIIDAIKGGTLIYVYADNREYLTNSPILAHAPAAAL